MVEKLNELRKPKVQWVDFLNEEGVRSTLANLKTDAKPLFGKMKGQQMVEHLSIVTQIANGNWNVDIYVSDEKTARRKPFLNSDSELQIGFKAPFLSEDPTPLKFYSMEEAIDDLLKQVQFFEKVFTENPNRTVVHPFFGELDYEYWKKFQVKHFTHHFKQFGLV